MAVRDPVPRARGVRPREARAAGSRATRHRRRRADQGGREGVRQGRRARL